MIEVCCNFKKLFPGLQFLSEQSQIVYFYQEILNRRMMSFSKLTFNLLLFVVTVRQKVHLI